MKINPAQLELEQQIMNGVKVLLPEVSPIIELQSNALNDELEVLVYQQQWQKVGQVVNERVVQHIATYDLDYVLKAKRVLH